LDISDLKPSRYSYTGFAFAESAWCHEFLNPLMKDGDIIEQGSHDQLLEAGGFYADLYNSQFSQGAVSEE